MTITHEGSQYVARFKDGMFGTGETFAEAILDLLVNKELAADIPW